MTQTAEPPLIATTRRLKAALDRLERNLQQLSVTRDRELANEQKVTLFMRENEGLKAERESLTAAFGSLTHQYEDLQKVARTIHGKLDNSARRISEILEG
jgi:hypothetical protein